MSDEKPGRISRCPQCGARNYKDPVCWLCLQPLDQPGEPPPEPLWIDSEESSGTDQRRTSPVLVFGMLMVFFGSVFLRGPAFLLALLMLPAIALQVPSMGKRREESAEQADDEEVQPPSRYLPARRGWNPLPRRRQPQNAFDLAFDIMGRIAAIFGMLILVGLALVVALFVICSLFLVAGGR